MTKRRFSSSDFDSDYVIRKEDLRNLIQDFIASEVDRRLKLGLENYFRDRYTNVYDEG
jgi:hypothetical protein